MTNKYKVLMISSSGGVLLDLLALEPWWKQHTVSWAVVKAADTETALSSHTIHWMKERRLSHPLGAIAGVMQSMTILRAVRPDIVVSAGSGVAIGFFLAAKILRIPSFWLETFNIIDSPGVSGRLCSRLASAVLVQRPSMLKAHPKAIVLGELY